MAVVYDFFMIKSKNGQQPFRSQFKLKSEMSQKEIINQNSMIVLSVRFVDSKNFSLLID